MDLLGLFSFLTPDDEKPATLVKWRAKLAAAISLLYLAVFLVIPTSLPFVFVTKASAEEEHNTIHEELTDIKQSISQLVTNDLSRAEREKAREIREVRAAILELQLQACRAEGQLRAQLNIQVGELRSEYMGLTGEEFPPTPCADLLGTP